MLLPDIKKLDNNQLFLLAMNTVQDHQEIGLQRDHFFKELRQLLLKALKEFTEATLLAWVSYLSNSELEKTQNH
jgi:hypothetical protein